VVTVANGSSPVSTQQHTHELHCQPFSAAAVGQPLTAKPPEPDSEQDKADDVRDADPAWCRSVLAAIELFREGLQHGVRHPGQLARAGKFALHGSPLRPVVERLNRAGCKPARSVALSRAHQPLAAHERAVHKATE